MLLLHKRTEGEGLTRPAMGVGSLLIFFTKPGLMELSNLIMRSSVNTRTPFPNHVAPYSNDGFLMTDPEIKKNKITAQIILGSSVQFENQRCTGLVFPACVSSGGSSAMKRVLQRKHPPMDSLVPFDIAGILAKLFRDEKM